MSQNQRKTQQQQKTQEKVKYQQGHEEETTSEAQNKKRRRRRHKKGGKATDAVSGGSGNIKLAVEKEPLKSSEQNQLKMSKPVTPVACRKAAGSNWETALAKTGENVSPQETTTLTKSQRHRQKRREALQKYVAMDCEMVGVGLDGQSDMLARVSIVNKRGQVLLDKFVKPQRTVTDYRTSISGIRPHDIVNGEDVKTVRDEVVKILQGKILVGHSVNKDLAVLHVNHPKNNIRDTAFYKPLRRLVANGYTPSLKRLAAAILGKQIQIGEHNSVEDARAVMSIYNCLASDWEEYNKRHQHKNGK